MPERHDDDMFDDGHNSADDENDALESAEDRPADAFLYIRDGKVGIWYLTYDPPSALDMIELLGGRPCVDFVKFETVDTIYVSNIETATFDEI